MYEPTFTLPTVRLFGGFTCVMLPRDQNEWHEFSSARPEWKRMKEIEVLQTVLAAQSNAGIDVSSEAAALMTEIQAIADAFYNIGKEWFAGLCDRRAALRKAAVGDMAL